ncbi:MAG TPA: PspC domain-containing protein [Solirubrobacterales bacterium]|nr:PspC domain-containing protein [Solirubrobacterales bacterium]
MNDETDRSPEDAPGDEGTTTKRARRLLRSRDDRMIAGVAGGLGRYFAVDPTIVRIAFVVSIFFGGLGVFAYLALALFVPSAEGDGEIEPAPIERSRGLAIAAGVGIVIVALSWGAFDGGWGWDGGPWFFGPPLVLLAIGAGLYFLLRNTGNTSVASVVGKIVLGLCLLFLAGCAAMFSAWAGATGHGVAVAGVITAIGVLLALAAFRGGARWLVAPAVVLAIPLGTVAAADISFGDGVGEREYRPAAIESLPAAGYELGVGRLAIDLRELEWGPRTVVDLQTDLGIGEMVIAVPESVCVSADATAAAGDIQVAGDSSDGIDAEFQNDVPADAVPQLDLDAEVDLGAIRVLNDDEIDIDHEHDWDDFEDDDEEMEERQEVACTVEPETPASGAANQGARGTKGGE